MGPFAWWIDNINGDDNNDGSYESPYRTLSGAMNDIELNYPKQPEGIFYEKSSGKILSIIPKDLSNNLSFVQYVGY